ncbi:MAG: replication initiation protein [Thiofilum sp.]|uniref:RepB family plasmid replication initiator protein n=1 Tax=Thiofilum sp. TaxID=2212733 RepID=UPI0025D58B20|nr:RepB family plasmid replication initiator protein [Thiofilum sp.]MBK8455373.1 replication initiation protein [Thiofilum sp.]
MGELIVKSNDVIEASYRLTLNEQRLILLCIQQIKKGQAITQDTKFIVRASDFSSTFGVSEKRSYSDLKDVADTLFERRVMIYKPDKDIPSSTSTKTRWVQAVTYIPNEGAVCLYFGLKVLPYISMLEGNFTRYNIEYVASMNSVYGLRFYELFKCWLMGDKSKIKTIPLNELKDLLALKDTKGGYQYPSIKDFKLHVIDKGLDDVNQHTDLQAAYETKKTGRRITDLEFTIKLKSDTKPKQETKRPALPDAKPNTKPASVPDERESKADLEHLKKLAALGGVPLETLLKPAKKAKA